MKYMVYVWTSQHHNDVGTLHIYETTAHTLTEAKDNVTNQINNWSTILNIHSMYCKKTL